MHVLLHVPSAALHNIVLAQNKCCKMRSNDYCSKTARQTVPRSSPRCMSLKTEVQTAGDFENVVPPTDTKRLRVHYIRAEGDTKVPYAIFNRKL